jgi:hypothetical protein
MITTLAGTPVAHSCARIVHGDRGSYVEFTREEMDLTHMAVPKSEEWRVKSPVAYYVEWRTVPDKVMVYQQKKKVSYADYKVGRWYIAVGDLVGFEGQQPLMRRMVNTLWGMAQAGHVDANEL